MNLKDLDLSLEVDIYNDGGTLKVTIADECSTGSTYEVETLEDIKNALQQYLEDNHNIK